MKAVLTEIAWAATRTKNTFYHARYHKLAARRGKMLKKSNLSHIKIDCESTVSTVFSNQEGVDKGYNPYKKRVKIYHLQLTFCA